jgi:MoaA/NifB/PqqE/SkfB family radical SAM enzyme
MCHIWQHPTQPRDEVSLDTLAKLPSGFDNLNITGGEPTLRNDLTDIVALLYPKAKTLEISSNGLHSDRLEPIIKAYPNIKIRFSLEAVGERSDEIRGERTGSRRRSRDSAG